MARIVRNPDVLWREEEEVREKAYAGLEAGEEVEGLGTSILFINGRILSLNLLGTEIWKLCDGRSEEALVEELASQFDAPRELLQTDVGRFLSELSQEGFIRYE